MKETVKERAILQEKITEGRINGKNAMTVSDINELKGHRGSAIHGIFITAGRAETAVTTERNKLEISAVDTAIHGTTIRRITTVDHLIDIFHLSRSGMKSIFDLFIMICKDLL
jgi:S-adenosylmethionine:tRNA-ribosyltransferase-isomerase (queuine synthetase)